MAQCRSLALVLDEMKTMEKIVELKMSMSQVSNGVDWCVHHMSEASVCQHLTMLLFSCEKINLC